MDGIICYLTDYSQYKIKILVLNDGNKTRQINIMVNVA